MTAVIFSYLQWSCIGYFGPGLHAGFFYQKDLRELVRETVTQSENHSLADIACHPGLEWFCDNLPPESRDGISDRHVGNSLRCVRDDI